MAGRRVLVVSTGALNEPHRRPFAELARRHGWDVHVVAPRSYPAGSGEPKPCAPAPPDAAYTLWPLPARSAENGRLTWFSGLAALARRLAPDVVFAEFDPGSLVVLESWGATLGRVPLVGFTVENIAHDRVADMFANARRGRLRAAARDALVASLETAGARALASLACLNEEGLALFGARAPFRDRVALMPIGTDPALFRKMDAAERRRELGLADAFVVGYFGRLVPEKGPDLLVEALAQLPTDTRLLLDVYRHFAPGSFADGMLRRARALGVDDRIVTVDVPHAEVPALMNCCDCVALPSRSTPRWREQFGRVLPEAMACEVPVIGARSGNIPALVGDAGLLVEEGSAAAIAEAVGRLRASPALRRDLGQRGRARVQAALSVDVQVDVLHHLLLDALAGGRVRPRARGAGPRPAPPEVSGGGREQRPEP